MPDSPHLPRELKPPARFGDFGQLEQLLWTNLPQLATYMAGLFGTRTPQLTNKEISKQKARLHTCFTAARPYLLGLWALNNQSDRQQCFYALMEGLFRELFRGAGKKIPTTKDSIAYLLESTERLARAPNRAWAKSQPYSSARQSLCAFTIFLQQQASQGLIEQVRDEWARSSDARKFFQTIMHWPTLTRQFRVNPPKRLTPKTSHQLATEYRTSSALFEQRVRLLVALDHAASGFAKDWTAWQKTTLFDLLSKADASPHLNWIPSAINRHVRNALAHGEPELNPDTQECRFHDRDVTVRWKVDHFFERARHLTLTSRALLEFESLVQLTQARALVATLWGGFSETPSGPK